MSALILTEAQKKFVWRYVCAKMASDDKNPCEVVREDYAGDLGHYLSVMANWHDIKFCSVCEKANKDLDKEDSGFQVGVGPDGGNLCGACVALLVSQRSQDPSVA